MLALSRNSAITVLSGALILLSTCSVGAEDAKSRASGNSSGITSGKNTGKAGMAFDSADGSERRRRVTIDSRIVAQKNRIEAALKRGSIDESKAQELRQSVLEVEMRVKESRKANGGKLKVEERNSIKSALNQTGALIQSASGAGSSVVQKGDALGAKWSKGPDGAQNPRKLKAEMKKENRRELRQERQATMQKIEQQQLDYEKEMVEKLGEQRSDILQQKSDLKEVREGSGAN